MGWFNDLGHSFDDSLHSIGDAIDNTVHGDFSDAGDYVGKSFADYQPVFGEAGAIGDYIGDLAQMGGFYGEEYLKRLKEDPLQGLIGATNPLNTKVANKALGTDWTPWSDMYGAPTTQTYQNAERAGIDTSNARGAVQAGEMAANYLGAGPIAGIGGGGAWGAATAGGTFGAVNALNNNTNVGKGAFQGALGSGAANTMNFAGMAGLEDPQYQRMFNGAVGGGIKSGLTGDSIGQGAAMGAGGAFLKGQMNNMNQESNFPTGGQSYAPYDPNSDWKGQMMGQSIPSASTGGMPVNQSMPDWMGGVTPSMPQQQRPQQSMYQQLQQNPWFRGLGGIAGGLNPILGKGMDSMGMGGNTFDTIGRTLGSLYTQNRAKKDAQEQMNRMDVMRGAYSNDMQNRLNRRDAASGRRSQYGPREVELQARLADLDSRNAPQMKSFYDQRRGAQMGMLNDAFTGVRRLGGPGQIYNDVSNYFRE